MGAAPPFRVTGPHALTRRQHQNTGPCLRRCARNNRIHQKAGHGWQETPSGRHRGLRPHGGAGFISAPPRSAGQIDCGAAGRGGSRVFSAPDCFGHVAATGPAICMVHGQRHTCRFFLAAVAHGAAFCFFRRHLQPDIRPPDRHAPERHRHQRGMALIRINPHTLHTVCLSSDDPYISSSHGHRCPTGKEEQSGSEWP